MPAPNVLRAKQREEIKPLIDALNQALAGQTRMSIAERSGLTNYQVGRILGDYLPAPTYLDITKLLGAAGISPNDAAATLGLYEPSDQRESVLQTPYERRVVELLRSSQLTATQRNLLTQVIEATVRGLEGHALLDASIEETPTPVTSRRRSTGS